MKKWIALLLAAMLLLAVGFYAGCKLVLSSPKWVEEEAGLYIICTELAGNVYTDVAEKAGHQYDAYTFALRRR